jgi:hypothetical protein
MLQSVPIYEGDWFIDPASGRVVIIHGVVEQGELELAAPWSGSALEGAPYQIAKMSWLRYDPANTQQQILNLLAALRGDTSVLYRVSGANPDDGLGNENDFAFKFNDGRFQMWKKAGGTWVAVPVPVVFNVALNISGKPQAGETPPGFIFTEFVTFPAGLAASFAMAQIPAAAETVVTLEKNGTQFATLTFGESETVGILDSDAEASFEAGDVLTWVWPNPRDATLAGVSMTLRGIA